MQSLYSILRSSSSNRLARVSANVSVPNIGSADPDLELIPRMPFIMLCWGIFTIAHAWTRSYGMLVALRLMIGLFEAGFYPTACFYLSTFYTRYDLAIRIGIFYGMYAVAGAFSAAIAYGIFQINGALYGWQYLFIIGRPLLCMIVNW